VLLLRFGPVLLFGLDFLFSLLPHRRRLKVLVAVKTSLESIRMTKFSQSFA
jgi:hypothetical protein